MRYRQLSQRYKNRLELRLPAHHHIAFDYAPRFFKIAARFMHVQTNGMNFVA